MQTAGIIVFTILTLVTVLAFVVALNKKVKILSLGVPENRSDNSGLRWSNFFRDVLGQRKMLSETYGIVHLVLFWGFIMVVIAEIPFVLEGLNPAWVLPFLGTNPYFYLIKDIMAILVVVGLLVASVRRWILRPPQLYRTLEAVLVVIFVIAVIVTEWISSGAKFALEPNNAAYALDPAYTFLKSLFAGMDEIALAGLQNTFWWIHLVILYTFMIYIPNSKHLHILASPFNGYFASLKPYGGQIEPMNLDDVNLTEYGVGRVEQFTRKQLLDSFACGECGRCMENCPAANSGKPLNPRDLLAHTIKNHLLEKGEVMNNMGLKSAGEENAAQLEQISKTNPQAYEVLSKKLIGDVVDRDAVWSCTTCMACQEVCPVSNEHVNKIIDMRRYEVMNEDNYSPELQLAFRNTEAKYNPWGVSWSERAAWAKGLDIPLMKEAGDDVEYLFWVGCAGSFDSRAKKVTVSVAKILKAAGVKFAILGKEEKCCGDFIRRAGNEYLYQLMVKENVQLLNNYKVKKIITTCPHCLNTFMNEYPAFSGQFEVVHHTQLIDSLIRSGKLSLNSKVELPTQRIVYHDSCYLGRYQKEYNAPRELFKRVPGVELVEMDRSHAKSFCCGAGGGRMWMEETIGERINNLRVEQALDKAPQAIGANCPYCITMLEDGIKDKADPAQNIQVVDPAELIVKML